MSPPENLLELTKRAVTRFLWYPSRKPKIKHTIIQNSKNFGGASAPNLEIKIPTSRIIFLVQFQKLYSHLKSNVFS